MGWLDRFPGRKPAGDPQALGRVTPGDSIEAWPSGFVDVSVGRFWPVDRIVAGTGGHR